MLILNRSRKRSPKDSATTEVDRFEQGAALLRLE
jgi:hypothetical protein